MFIVGSMGSLVALVLIRIEDMKTVLVRGMYVEEKPA